MNAPDKSSPQFPAARLATPPCLESADNEQFQCLIIGSGFGGAVMAARLAPYFSPGSIAILERGQELLPGEFPGNAGDAMRSIRSVVNPLGLFDFYMRPDMDILCANALGGGSNIYANVTLEPDPEAFAPQVPASGFVWPSQIQFAQLTPYFNRVRQMLAVEKHIDARDIANGIERFDPELAGSFLYGAEDGYHSGSDDSVALTDYLGRRFSQRPPLAKAEILRQVASANDGLNKTTIQIRKAPIAVNLTGVANGEKNAHGVVQNKCDLCGDCVTGCNRGAKNSLNFNYLPLAKQSGCSLRTQVEVQTVGHSDDPNFRYRLQTRHWVKQDDRWVFVSRSLYANMVILAAGVLGSTSILMRSQREHELHFSPCLGKGISGNLDLISFSYAGNTVTNTARITADNSQSWEVGPTIVSNVELAENGKRKYLIQEGCWPSVLTNPLARILGASHFFVTTRDAWHRLGKAKLYGQQGMAINRSMVWLSMGRDNSTGELRLTKHDKIQIHWPFAGSQHLFDEIHATLNKFSAQLQASYLQNPRENYSWIGRSAATPITVHPLGGCRMGKDSQHGVTDHVGRVFRGNGDGFYPGLYVMDGSVIGTALGANPSLTIAALAERAAEHIIKYDLQTSSHQEEIASILLESD